MKREATILLPMVDDRSGASMFPAHERMVRELVTAFGGATTTMGLIGFWLQPTGEMETEKISSYAIAMNVCEDSKIALRDIARRYGAEAHQRVVYVRHADDEVEFVETGISEDPDEIRAPDPVVSDAGLLLDI